MTTHEDIEDWFSYHQPQAVIRQEQHEKVRAFLRETAHALLTEMPQCDERDKAIDSLRVAMFWANSGIACSPE
jgi:hypothetical protein